MKDSYFLSQPHQPFFLLATLNAVVFMLLFLLSYKGVVTPIVDVAFLHSYSLVFLVFLNAFTGFLFTTFPRFNQTQIIAKSYYSEVFYANGIASLLFATGVFGTKLILLSSILIALASHFFIFWKLLGIYKSSRVNDKSDSFWILTGMGFGVVGHFFFLLSFAFAPLLHTAVGVSVFLFLLFSAFSVAQRMIPFFSHSFAPKSDRFVLGVFVLFLIECVGFVIENVPLRIVVEFLLSFFLAKEFLRWKLHPLQSPAILWVLHLSLFWLPVGFFLFGVSDLFAYVSAKSFYFLGIHLLLLGFLLTVLIGFGTRVVLGHSGQAPHADGFIKFLFLLTQIVVIARALVSLDVVFGWGMSFLFDIAAALWTLLFVLWGVRFGKVLLFGAAK